MKILFFNYCMPIGLICMLLFSVNCQRDDICDSPQITPRLIIEFVDDEANVLDTISKNVEQLAVRLIVDKNNVDNVENRFVTASIVDSSFTTSSLQLPLDTLKDELTFVFTKNFGDENTARIVEDTLVFKYQRAESFINRACGFQTTFDNLEVERRTNVWISDIDILTTTITNEDDRHLLFHH